MTQNQKHRNNKENKQIKIYIINTENINQNKKKYYSYIRKCMPPFHKKYQGSKSAITDVVRNIAVTATPNTQ